ncbi:winged helix-turn-helix domain-containing protein [Humidisolicoccus flavus]|uniref:winged helix-turn-helix domain-containing protein n=1 Tax=Humidisolicoccus flavus TaxID=3111414 RepID=UPI00324E9998
MLPHRRFTPAQARRIALAASGIGKPVAGPERPVRGTLKLKSVIDRLGLLQVDSVNVFERSHYIPVFSRVGVYDRAVLDKLLNHDAKRPKLGSYSEYWAHEAAILPLTDLPLWQWKQARQHDSSSWRSWLAEHRGLLDEVRAEFANGRPLRASDIEHPQNVRTGPPQMWSRSNVRIAIEFLFSSGELVATGRTRFERQYVHTDSVPALSAAEVPSREAAQLELVRRAAKRVGIGTLKDIGDYFRLKVAPTSAALTALEDSGEVRRVVVDGWGEPAYLHHEATLPRAIRAATVFSPFDPVVWFRPRLERLFGMHYRISIYTPAAQRTDGYYALPVLVDDQIVGRIDLKSDRQSGLLRVQHARLENASEARSVEISERIAPVLRSAAAWQGLDSVSVSEQSGWQGDLARALDDRYGEPLDI